MAQIQPMELLAVLQKVEARGAVETADRALMLARQVGATGYQQPAILNVTSPKA